MADPVRRYLERFGPALSSEVAAALVAELGMTPVAARKRVSRAGDEVRRVAGVTFPHKARFLYLQQQFGSPWYWDRLSKALIETRSAYGYALAALRQRDGIVPTLQFPIVCGAPVKQAKHLSPDTIFDRLNQAGLLTKVTVSGVGECIALVQADGYYESSADRQRARAITEDVLLLAVKDWLKKTGMVSFGQVALRGADTPPKVGTFVWDLSAPSYLGPMVRPSKDGKLKPGFVACDVYLGDTMTEAGVAPFIRKCVTLRSLRNVGACLQILIADRYDTAAFHLLKAHGIMPATPANLFGEEVADGLRQLTSVLDNAARSIIDPSKFDELFSRLGRIEGASHQLRGTLFEYVAADMARKTLSADIRMNRLFKATAGRGQAEADVIAVREHQSITVIECKGYNPWANLPDDKFRRWLDHNVPTAFKAIKAHPDWQNLSVAFEFWSTAPLSEDMLTLFEKQKAAINPQRYTIALKLGPELHDICRQTQDPSLITAYEKHFMRLEAPQTGSNSAA